MRRAVFPLTLSLSLLLAGLAWAQEDEEFPGDDAPPAETEFAEPAAAPAEPAPVEAAPAATTAGDMYIGLTIGPAIGAVERDGNVFYFGPEFGMKNFQIPLLLGFKDSTTFIDIIPRFKYPIEIIPNLIVAPFGGLKLGFALNDFGTFMNLGVEVGARGTYMVTPNIGIFLEPVVLDFDFFQWFSPEVGDSGTEIDFGMLYRLHFGAQYHF